MTKSLSSKGKIFFSDPKSQAILLELLAGITKSIELIKQKSTQYTEGSKEKISAFFQIFETMQLTQKDISSSKEVVDAVRLVLKELNTFDKCLKSIAEDTEEADKTILTLETKLDETYIALTEGFDKIYQKLKELEERVKK